VIRGARGAILAALLLLAGCSTRERLNPLDPKNSKTQGGLTGFNAIAADNIVEFHWPALTLEGVLGYRVQRWRPGGSPQDLGAADYHPGASAGEDTTAANDSTYVYRLVAHLANGDSAMSPPDTATPGLRSIFVLEAGVPAFSRLSPDGRDLLFQRAANESYVDMEMDRKGGIVWLSAEGGGFVLRKAPDGATVGAVIDVGAPGDISVSSNRGVGWVVSLSTASVLLFGPDLGDPAPQRAITGVGHPRVVEAGTTDPSVWVGNEEGTVFRFRAADVVETYAWPIGDGTIRAIALDEAAGAAWVATRSGDVGNLYYLNPADSSATLVKTNLLNPADLAVDPSTGDLWVSERGAPKMGAGRLSLITRSGTTLASVVGIEPYGVDVDPVNGTCWVSDLRSNRVLDIDRSGAILRSSPALQTPYAVRVAIP
jgi:DNA-binding beta-propeller fold protein YncE